MFEHILPNGIRITKTHPVLPEYLKEEIEIYPKFKVLKSINEKYRFIKNYIDNLVLKLNNPRLEFEEKVFYKMFSDGTVKKFVDNGIGSYVEYEIIRPNTFFNFPIKGKNETYAIMTYENCIKVRYFMDQLLLKT
jgi:hypothetical protein